ncbi:MAG: SusC/RagA family TonB-linked outer membrane protein, partial [Polaribacter sp.]
MKISILLLFTSIFTLQANESYSQHTKISLNLKNVTVEQLIDKIENKTEFRFLYLLEDVNLKRIVSVKAKREKINSILDRIFSGTETTYQIDDRQISLVKRVKSGVKEKIQKSIQGKVTDKIGQPLPGASILEKGTTNGVQTDFDGNFKLKVIDDKAILVVSYLGFVTKEVPLNGKTSLIITLQEDAAGLDEVVIVGYGSQSTKKVTGSISSIKSEQIADLPVASFDQALAGQISGVQVSQSTGAPGEGAEIKIRGVGTLTAGSAPLLVIDGFPSESVKMSDINPNDIDNVQVLKDAASTSIYGSRGSNGVILVTTKKGKNGDAKINFNTYTGFQQVSNTYNMANGYEWVAFNLEAIRERNPGKFPSNYVPDAYQPYVNGTSGLINTDWQDEIFRAAPINSYQLSVSGGNDKTKYYVSGQFFNQDGVIINTDFKRYNLRANLTSDIIERPNASFLKKIKFGVNLAPSFTTTNKVSESHHNDDGIVITALYAYPIFAPYNSDGS